MTFGSNIMIIIALIFSVAFPLILTIWWKKKTGASLWSFIVGAICFALFAMFLEQFAHALFLNPGSALGQAVTGSAILYMIYGGLAAGIFEETGRLFGYKVLLRKHKDKETAVAYGIGHGGMEMLLILGLTYLIYALAKMGVEIGTPEATETILKAANSIYGPMAAVAIFERIVALTLHVGLSMIMFVAAKQEGKLWLYPIAILLHAATDFAACLYQYKIIASIGIVEMYALFMAVICMMIGASVMRGFKD